MDLAFLMRAERMLAREQTPPIDHGILVAALVVHQKASATARAAAEAQRSGGDWRGRHRALAELLAGGPAWREARRAQRGSFHCGLCDAAGKEP